VNVIKLLEKLHSGDRVRGSSRPVDTHFLFTRHTMPGGPAPLPLGSQLPVLGLCLHLAKETEDCELGNAQLPMLTRPKQLTTTAAATATNSEHWVLKPAKHLQNARL
jgi:hypothetical protein